MQKAPDAFRTISEVAELLDVPQHVLRFWETRFSQIRPMKRAGGRRYYRPQDVDLLRGIRKLLYDDGYTIKGVQKILREHGIAHVIAIGRGELEVASLVAPVIAKPAAVAQPAPEAAVAGTASDASGKVAGTGEAEAVVVAAAGEAAASGQAGLSEQERALLQEALGELEAACTLLEKALSAEGGAEQGADAGPRNA